MSNTDSTDDEWIRLPRPKEKCRYTGLSRTSLVEVLDEKDPLTGEPYVIQMRKERHGKQRRIRMIKRASLLEYFNKRASAQALRFAPHVNNPDNERVENVINDIELFGYFIDAGDGIPEEDWFGGKLSSRASRIQLLRKLGLIDDSR